MSQPVQPTADDVIAGALATLPACPNLAHYINADGVATSVNADWPSMPRPVLYLLYMASMSSAPSGQFSRQDARSLLGRIEELVAWLRSGAGVTGSWESRVRKMTTFTRYEGGERYTEFQSALFELVAAGQLRHSSVTITFLPDGGATGPDLQIAPSGDEAAPLVAVEAYAPHKGIAA